MAFTGITATEAEIDQKTGENVDVSYTDTMKTAALLHAESMVNAATRYNWSDYYAAGGGATANVDVKYIITEATASLVAIEAIKYNFRNYSSRTEAEDMINVLRDTAMRAISILRDKKTQTFIIGENN